MLTVARNTLQWKSADWKSNWMWNRRRSIIFWCSALDSRENAVAFVMKMKSWRLAWFKTSVSRCRVKTNSSRSWRTPPNSKSTNWRQPSILKWEYSKMKITPSGSPLNIGIRILQTYCKSTIRNFQWFRCDQLSRSFDQGGPLGPESVTNKRICEVLLKSKS